MFLHDFVMRGLLASIGKMPDYWIINSSLNWYDKGILSQGDLEEINSKLAPVEPIEEYPEEENEEIIDE
jgi:hypothetical protein